MTREITPVEVVLLVMGLAIVVMGAAVMAAALSPDSAARRRAARRRDLEKELEELGDEEKP